jgi:hypothetical protein
MIDRPCIQIGNRKAKLVIPPDKLAILDAIALEGRLIEPFPDIRLQGSIEEGAKVDLASRGAIEQYPEAILAKISRIGDVENIRYHFSLLVIVSGLRQQLSKILDGQA